MYTQQKNQRKKKRRRRKERKKERKKERNLDALLLVNSDGQVAHEHPNCRCTVSSQRLWLVKDGLSKGTNGIIRCKTCHTFSKVSALVHLL
jgi:hypothetical protein